MRDKGTADCATPPRPPGPGVAVAVSRPADRRSQPVSAGRLQPRRRRTLPAHAATRHLPRAADPGRRGLRGSARAAAAARGHLPRAANPDGRGLRGSAHQQHRDAAAAPDPPPGTCTTEQILLGNSCQSLVLAKELPSAADSLAYWKTQNAFTNQPALQAVKAHYAFGNSAGGGYGGEGIRVAVVDDGIQRHQVFQDADGNTAARLTRLSVINYVDHHGNQLPGVPTLPSLAAGSGKLGVNDIARDDSGDLCLSRGDPGSGCEYDHGTAVASVLAAHSTRLLGAAPAAHVVDIPYFAFIWDDYCSRENVDCSDRSPDSPHALVRAGILGSVMHAAVRLADKPRYINLPLALDLYLPDAPPSDSDLLDDIQELYLDRRGGRAIWSQVRDPVNGSVFVFAAGNEYLKAPTSCLVGGACPAGNLAKDPSILGMFPLLASWYDDGAYWDGADLEPAFLVVAAVDVDDNGAPGAIAGFSNRCGRAKSWCISAPGTNIVVAQGTRNRLDPGSRGTSFAAPLVTGAMALVDQAFTGATGASSVSPQAVRRRILDTANSEGVYADEDIYGHGLLDIEAALTPQGLMVMPSPSPAPGTSVGAVRGPGTLAAGLGFALPAVVRQALAGTRLMVLDGHGFPFHLPMQAFVHTPQADNAAPAVLATARNAAPVRAGRLGFSASGLSEDGNASWSSALAPEHQLAGARLAAGSHLHVSPLVAAGLAGGNTQHLALRLRVADSVVSAMTCERLHTGQALREEANSAAASCMALGWDWAGSQSWGLSLRAHRMDSRTGLYGYGMRCLAGACGQGGATATELGVGGFARLAPGLRLGWNWWQGRASDQRGAVDLIRYEDMGHNAGTIALEDASGRWSLYLQQPLRATGTLALTLPHYRTPAGEVHFQRHAFDLDSGGHPLRLGFSGLVPLTERGGALALNLGTERGLHAAPGTHPYLNLEASIPW